MTELQQRGLTIDFLVNNAGYGVPGSYVNVAWPDHARFMQVMVTAVLDLTYRLFPAMLERGWGRIVNIASVAGMVPAPAGHTLYGASKAFLIRFSEALSAEGAPKGVHVTAVCPGFTYSEFHDVTGTRDRMNKMPGFLWLDARVGGARGLRRRDAGPLRGRQRMDLRVPGVAERRPAAQPGALGVGPGRTAISKDVNGGDGGTEVPPSR